jgi:hypothetical protein
MDADNAAHTGERSRPSLLSRLKVPAILLLILVNVFWFGGNSLLDLWQWIGPARTFSGAISGHERVLTKGEDPQEYFTLTVTTATGPLGFDVTSETFAATQLGQQATGKLDSRGLFGHDEALRSLTADGKQVFQSRPASRVLHQLFNLVVVLTLAGIATAFVLRSGRRSRTRARAAAESAHAPPAGSPQ